MDNAIKVTIYDSEGDCLLNDKVNSPFVGLQAGETFWFGSGNNRTWSKIIKITYGLDTNSNCFVIEIVVEKSEKKETKNAIPDTTFTNHGLKDIIGNNGGSWSINNGDIIATIGANKHYVGYVETFTLQINGSKGPLIKSAFNVNTGGYIELSDKQRKIICTIQKISDNKVVLGLTETKFA